MSEYQYYDFRAIDRPLNREQMDELRKLSTRAEITSTSFINSYQWSDFKGNPDALMDRYFDTFIYFANWGTHRLMLRIPAGFLDVDVASTYCNDEILSIEVKPKHIILEFRSDDESGADWSEEDEHWVTSLIPLRAELIGGDTRALYLGWLASLRLTVWDSDDEVEAQNQLEPPVPSGLSSLSAPLQSLASFLRLEPELIEVAASANASPSLAEPSEKALIHWVKELSEKEKEAYLERFVVGDGDHLIRAELSRRFREATQPKSAKTALSDKLKRRTVGELLAASDLLIEANQLKAREQKAREETARQQEIAEARSKYLNDLSRRELATWREIETLIGTKLTKNYGHAVNLIVDLREVAERSGNSVEFEAKVSELRQRYMSKHSLIKRFNDNRLS